jgi:ferredoxin-NADP reductase
MAQLYTVILQEKKEIAKDTMAFYFTKPADFFYKAGQSVDITLLNPPETDILGNTRTLSLSSAPFQDYIMITLRMRDSAFKRVLKNLEKGTQLHMEGPWGSFALHQDTQTPAIFITGGIGITAVFSLLQQITYDKLSHRLLLFYTNKTAEDATFMPELEKLTETNLNFTFIPTMTRDEIWHGIKGRITKDLLNQYIRDLTKPIYYLCGPASMTADFRELLLETGVHEDNIIFEDFSGY